MNADLVHTIFINLSQLHQLFSVIRTLSPLKTHSMYTHFAAIKDTAAIHDTASKTVSHKQVGTEKREKQGGSMKESKTERRLKATPEDKQTPFAHMAELTGVRSRLQRLDKQ